MKKHKAYRSVLLKIQRQHNAAVTDLAESIRTEVLIPLCRKHKMVFLSGNGDFFFVKSDEDGVALHISGPDDALDWPDIREAIALLMEEVARHDHLGFWVDNVTKKDLDK